MMTGANPERQSDKNADSSQDWLEDELCDDEDEDDDDDGDGSGDGGWGWVVMIASLVCNTIVDGVCYTFGILKEHYMVEFQVSHEQVAWVSSLQTCCYMIVGEQLITLLHSCNSPLYSLPHSPLNIYIYVHSHVYHVLYTYTYMYYIHIYAYYIFIYVCIYDAFVITGCIQLLLNASDVHAVVCKCGGKVSLSSITSNLRFALGQGMVYI